MKIYIKMKDKHIQFALGGFNTRFLCLSIWPNDRTAESKHYLFRDMEGADEGANPTKVLI